MIGIGTGLVCPVCGGSKTEVKDSRVFMDGIRRRRLCVAECQGRTRYTTIETIVADNVQGRSMTKVTQTLNLLGEVEKLPAHKREIVLSLVAVFAADETGRSEIVEDVMEKRAAARAMASIPDEEQRQLLQQFIPKERIRK